MTLNGEILPHFNGGFDQIDTIRRAAARGKPLLMVDGRGNIWGDWVVTQIDETSREFYSDGAPRSISFSISLVEYGADKGSVSRLGGVVSTLSALARLI